MDKIVVIEKPNITLLQPKGSDELKVIASPTSTVLKVSTTETKLNVTVEENKVIPLQTEFLRLSNGTTFVDLVDSPSTYAGSAGKVVAVNSTETGLTFVDQGTGGGQTPSSNDDAVAFAIIFGS